MQPTDFNMSHDKLTLVLYGFLLCTVFGVIIAYYFSSKRKDSVEKAKYRMLEDDDEEQK
jgi:cbb3-type cytochrome oxidase subunit 3